MERPAQRALVIGDFRVEPSLNRVVHGNETVRLTPKAMRVLLCLAERHGEVVRRDELLAVVWGDVKVTEDVLNRSIADLRKAFDDRPASPRFIETIPKTGYRLVAAVSEPTGAAVRAVSALPAEGAAPSRLWLWGTVAAALLAVAAVALRFSSPPPSPRSSLPPPRQPPRVVPLSSLPGFEIQPRISPDGTRVAFTHRGADESESWDVYVRDVDGEGLLRLTHDAANDMAPAWSPDGTRVAFVRYRDDGCTIYTASALGSPERKVAGCGRNVNPDLVWSPDGRWLAFSDRESEEESFGIYLLSTDSLEKHRLAAAEGQHWGDKDPSFSPDSRQVVFTRSVSMATQDLYRVDVDGGEAERLTFDARAVFGHSFSPDGSSIVFVSERGGTPDLWRMPSAGGEPEWLAIAAGSTWHPDVSRHDGRLVFVAWWLDSDIHRLDLESAAGESTPWIVSTREDFQPRYAGGGRRVAFVSRRSGSPEIWIRDGDDELRLTSFGGPYTGAPRFSPDGRRLVFDSRPEGHADVFVVDAAGGAPVRLTETPSNELDPCYSTDGAWIYFGSDRTARWQIWKLPAKGGESVQVTRDGGYAAVESPDGAWLYFTRYDAAGFFRVPAAGGGEELVRGTESWRGWRRVHLGKDGLYFVDRGDDGRYLALLDPETGASRRLAAIGDAVGDITVSPDGRQLLYTEVNGGGADLMLARWSSRQ